LVSREKELKKKEEGKLVMDLSGRKETGVEKRMRFMK